MLHSSAEYSRRAAVIESNRARRSPAAIIRFFGYMRSIRRCRQYNASEESEECSANLARKSHSRERVSRAAAVDVIPPHFFEKGQTATKKAYLLVLQTLVKPWMVIVASGRPYFLQQDGVPSYTRHLVQNWLSDDLDVFLF